MGKRATDEWDVERWMRLYEGGRYLACCWNLVPPTGNYRAASLPVTTAVLWIGHKSPPTPMLRCQLRCYLEGDLSEQIMEFTLTAASKTNYKRFFPQCITISIKHLYVDIFVD